MYWIVEEEYQFENLKLFCSNNVYVEVIPDHQHKHPVEQNIIGYYLRPLTDKKGYIIPTNHTETNNIDNNIVEEFIKGIPLIYTFNKKKLLHNLKHRNIIDIQSIYKELQTDYPLLLNNFNRKKISNSITPIVKLYEHYENVYEEIQPHITENVNRFYNDKLPLIFSVIESSGIKIDKNIFTDHFYATDKDVVYSQYNYNTVTTRPSNTFNKINFAALNKEDGSRRSFIPHNDVFVEFDISSYHIYLLCKLVDYEFEMDDIHQYFSSIYQVSYEESKKITFQQLYGGIRKEYEHIPFFQKVKNYSESLWSTFQREGQITCPVSGYVYKKESFSSMNSLKLLNYVLQNYETSTNSLIIFEILKLLRGRKSKLVLYVYDSFLLDISKEDRELLLDIQDIFTKFNLKTKIKYGKNYHELKNYKK